MAPSEHDLVILRVSPKAKIHPVLPPRARRLGGEITFAFPQRLRIKKSQARVRKPRFPRLPLRTTLVHSPAPPKAKGPSSLLLGALGASAVNSPLLFLSDSASIPSP